ncbi:sensor histidine kinase [Spirosoma arcticum]
MAGIKLFDQWRQKQQESQRLEREKLQNELQLLKLKLNPDFLFGSLHALHRLIQQQSTLAPEVVLKLAHFLRYVLYESQSDRMPLLREIEIIENYVSLQRSIHPAGLDVSFSVRGNLSNRTVGSLLLFQLVEHAFRDLPAERDNPYTDEPDWVSIDLAITETQLTLKVIDGQMNNRADNSNQLADIQKQLYFHYADSYDLQVYPEPDAYIVTLTLPFILSAESPASRLVNPHSSPDYDPTLLNR